jgi:transcriptional regulator with XRE-family HTH domain
MTKTDSLPERLEAALKAARKTRPELIGVTRLSRQAINKWFEGESSNLKMNHLFTVADFLGVHARWLATGDGPMAVAGAVHDDAAPYVAPRSVHGINCSPEGAQLGAEWDKIEGDEYRQLARDFIYGLVAAQKRAARRPGTPTTHPPRRKEGPKLPRGGVSID